MMKVNRAHIIDKMAENGFISNAQLADAAHVTRGALSRIMNNRAMPSQETVFKVAKALKCNPSEILILD